MTAEKTPPSIAFYSIISDIYSLQNELLDIVHDPQYANDNIGSEIIKTTKIQVAKIYYKLCEMEKNISEE